MDISKFEYLWRDSADSEWGLHVSDENSYIIIHLRDLDVLDIEDDEIYLAVIQEMLKVNVPILEHLPNAQMPEINEQIVAEIRALMDDASNKSDDKL